MRSSVVQWCDTYKSLQLKLIRIYYKMRHGKKTLLSGDIWKAYYSGIGVKDLLA